MSLQDLPNNTTSFDPMVTYDDLFNQLLSGLQTTVSWPDISAGDGQNKPTLPWDVDHFDHQSAVLSSKLRQHHIATAAAAAGGRTDNIGNSSFKPPIGDNNNSIQNLFHGFTGSLTSNQTQNFGSTGAVMTAGGGGGGGAPSQPRQRVRARRGQATDPHSIAERLRRERIAERMKGLQELVPNANKTDKASMLDDIIDYVKFLQLQVKALSMSRLGTGANNVAEGGCVGRSSNGPAAVTEKQVVKLMEEDMGSAMQYLQGKGLCLMPISVANAGGGYGPSSPNMSSVLTVQSANGLSVKDSP